MSGLPCIAGGRFVANLRGFETLASASLGCSSSGFVANLRGFETGEECSIKGNALRFVANLRGFETTHARIMN